MRRRLNPIRATQTALQTAGLVLVALAIPALTGAFLISTTTGMQASLGMLAFCGALIGLGAGWRHLGSR
ncbi:MAG TPA: hypothetical protein PK954_19525 [Anaerolineales bacterium]|nr:hypothetical protein [Anaerolineales bacterium]HRF49540.1 hypothetical protein [Anaerolineales bacterium]